MSYILEALKKSEQEREAADNSGHSRREWLAHSDIKTQSSLVPGLLIGLVLAAVVVGGVWLLRPEPMLPDDIDEILQPEVPVAVNKSAQASRPEVPMLKTEPEKKIQNLQSGLSDKKAVVDQPPAIARQASDISIQASPGESDSSAVSAAKAGRRVEKARRVLPPLSSLRKVPDLIITSHIYSSEAARRGVSMNGRDWSEGDFITEDVVLTEITAEGIVVEIDGWSLPLKRNKGWQALPSVGQ